MIMESSEKECFKTSPCDERDTHDDEDESEGKNESSTAKDGGSSSNSTVEESEKKPSVRPYVRSKMPRLRWTPDLHLRFVHAVERLGGQDRATPKLVLQFMNIKGLNIAHVKSHLQMYRSKKIDESNQGLAHHRLFMDGIIDRNIYNLSQLPLLPSFNLRQNSNPRYGDATWSNVHGKWMQNPTRGQIMGNKTRPGVHGAPAERIFGASYNYYRPENLDLCSRNSYEGSTWRANVNDPSNKNPIHRSNNTINSPSYGEIMSRHIQREITGLKRKSHLDKLDLSLSLGLESSNEEITEEDERLALSLCTTPSKKMKEDHNNVSVVGSENARGASTLDLTL